jgi:hypothetical protein
MSKGNSNKDTLKEKRRQGRPSVLEDDPHLVEKVVALRATGRSWAEISTLLRIGKTTARRLATVCQKGIESQTKDESVSAVPKTSNQRDNRDECQSFEFSVDDEFLECMPKTFRIFLSLVKRARDAQ